MVVGRFVIHMSWQDSRLVLSILTSISRGYELDSWAFPGLILYGSLTDWWPEIYILTGSTRDRSISRSEYSRGCLHWISLSRGFSRTLTRNLLVSPYVPGLILYGGCQDSWLEIWILSSSRRGIRMAACIEFQIHGEKWNSMQAAEENKIGCLHWNSNTRREMNFNASSRVK